MVVNCNCDGVSIGWFDEIRLRHLVRVDVNYVPVLRSLDNHQLIMARVYP